MIGNSKKLFKKTSLFINKILELEKEFYFQINNPNVFDFFAIRLAFLYLIHFTHINNFFFIVVRNKKKKKIYFIKKKKPILTIKTNRIIFDFINNNFRFNFSQMLK